jgi:hypothetical protein
VVEDAGEYFFRLTVIVIFGRVFRVCFLRFAKRTWWVRFCGIRFLRVKNSLPIRKEFRDACQMSGTLHPAEVSNFPGWAS